MLSRVNERVSIAINRNSFIQTFVALDTYRAYDYAGAVCTCHTRIWCLLHVASLPTSTDQIQYSRHACACTIITAERVAAVREERQEGQRAVQRAAAQQRGCCVCAGPPGHAASTVVIASASASTEHNMLLLEPRLLPP